LIDSWSWSNAAIAPPQSCQSESLQIPECNQADEDTFFNQEVMLFPNKRQKVDEEIDQNKK
jgi:hypothetical protein